MKISLKNLGQLVIAITMLYALPCMGTETNMKTYLGTNPMFKKIIHNLWNNAKPELFKWAKGQDYVSDGFHRSHPYELYDIQLYTDNLLKYAQYFHDTYILQELTSLYSEVFKTLESTDEYLFYYYPDSPRESIHKLSRSYKIWIDSHGREYILYSSQFLYIVSEALVTIVSLKTTERTPQMTNFVKNAVFILQEHYNRWLFSKSGPFQVRGWGCKINGKYVPAALNHYEFLKKKLFMQLGDQNSPSYCNAVTDTDMWIITGVSNLLTAHEINPKLVPLSNDKKRKFQQYLGIGLKLLESRIVFTNLKDYQGKKVQGADFDVGYWDDHPDYKYYNYKSLNYPSKQYRPIPPKNTSWDISHARRFVDVFYSLQRNSKYLHMDFPNKTVIEALANQFVYKVFNGNFKRPLFSNFWNGDNGWYRVSYSDRFGYGYGPSDLSIAALTGGYALWAKYNSDINTLYCKLCNMIFTDDDKVKEFLKAHYAGNRWRNFRRFELPIFTNKDTQSRISFLLSFIPSLAFIKDCNKCILYLSSAINKEKGKIIAK